jgi:hypothetical protein
MPGTITPSKSTLQAYGFILLSSKEVSKNIQKIKKRNLPMDGKLACILIDRLYCNKLHYETLKYTKK